MQIWPRDGEVWGKGGRVANRAYMMNIGHGDSNSSAPAAATGSDREGGLQDKVVFCLSCVKLMEGFVKTNSNNMDSTCNEPSRRLTMAKQTKEL